LTEYPSLHYKAIATLIALLAECLAAASRHDRRAARGHVEYWKTVQYPVFQRLVCFGLSLPDLFGNDEVVAYLSDPDSAMWIWPCHAEVCSLLTALWPSLDPRQSSTLIEYILDGPPRHLFRDGLTPAELEALRNSAVADRLSALDNSGRQLPPAAQTTLAELRRRDENAPGLSEDDGLNSLEQSPPTAVVTGVNPGDMTEAVRSGFRDNTALREWTSLVRDDWQQSLGILRELASAGEWPVNVWTVFLNQAISGLATQETNSQTVVPMLELIAAAPPEFTAAATMTIAQLMEFLPRTYIHLEQLEVYWRIWSKLLSAAIADVKDEARRIETTADAINTVTGRLTEALFEWLRHRSIASKTDVPAVFWESLALACRDASAKARSARCIASMHMNFLFAHNPQWTISTLLPAFSWQQPDEAKAAWGGCLLSAGISPNLWPHLRASFLAAFEHIAVFAEEPVRRLYEFFASIVINSPEWLTADECQRIVTRAPHLGRTQIAWVFWRSLDAAADRAPALWNEQMGPWLEAAWQPDAHLKSPSTSENLVRVAIAAGNAFPDALTTIEHRLGPVKHIESVLYEIERAQTAERFPLATMTLLDVVIDRRQSFYKGPLRDILEKVSRTHAATDSRFTALQEFAAG
jgi:hypothetical protein